jgi:hypothetical protein
LASAPRLGHQEYLALLHSQKGIGYEPSCDWRRLLEIIRLTFLSDLLKGSLIELTREHLMLFSSHKIKIDVYINYGNDNIRHKKIVAEPGISALDALAKVADIEYTPDESATCHHGAMVTAIDGLKVDINHFWIYYIFENDKAGWTIPMSTPDSLKIIADSRVAWRYHTATSEKEMQRYGPLSSINCISKIKMCNRQF